MKKILLFLFMLSLALLNSSPLFAQDWEAMMKDHNVNFFDVQKAFNKYYEKKKKEVEREKEQGSKKQVEPTDEEESEIPGYTQYKRWEWYMEPRVAVNGERFDPSMTWNELRKYRDQNRMASGAGNWTFMGPSTSAGLAGVGRLNFVRIHPNDPNTIYVGSPSGGLWKSTDAGSTWSTNTDLIAQVIGCSDLAIDPVNPNTMYLATGDETGAIAQPYSVGILKTTDGGNTWNTTALTYYLGNLRRISRVLVNPSNTDIVIAATSAGLYRSGDGGTTFTQVKAGSFKDMEFKPGDPSVVYACGAEFDKSTDSGQTWTKITSNLPVSTNVSRMAIAVTEADPNYVYLIAGLPQPNYGTEGFYKSTDNGTSFFKISTPGLGNQQWYDLAIASSPANRDEVVIGGQSDFLISTNGGVSWTDVGGSTHVDYHDIVYIGADSFYTTSDGGIYRTTNRGGSWSNLNNGLAISQMYGFGQSTSNANLTIQGWQDNGTNRYNGTWSIVMGGDGMLCFIDWNNDQNMWGEQFNGSLNKSTNGGASFSPCTGNINETGAWVTPWIQDPITPGTIYAGFINVWKSTSGGGTWTKISNFSGTATLRNIAVSPANNQVIWATGAGILYKTSNGGTTWTTISSIPSGTVTYIACSNTDENRAWITYSGFNNSSKVFQTNDQGVTWINLSPSLPNIPINCITYVKNSNDALYIGTDVGVFYKDASTNVWQPFFNGLPDVIITQLDISVPANKLRASTFGRGMWETELYQPGGYPPAAYFQTDKSISCPGAAVQFSDYSSGQPSFWNWSFPGGTPSTSTQQNQTVYYNTPGTYAVQLIVSNANGTDSLSYTNYITISSSPYSAPVTTGANRCGPGIVNLSATTTAPGVLRWWDAPGGGNILATGANYSPTISATTFYYVDVDISGGTTDFTGEFANNIGTGSFFTANDIRGMYFDVIEPVVLNTVDVYSNSAGNRTIEVLDAFGNTIVDTTVFVPASPTNPVTVTLNFTLYPGTNYIIKCRGYVDLYRNSSGATYPYTSSAINITGSNASIPGYYYFFYNWTYSTFVCNTGRTECIAADTCALGINNLLSNGSLEIYPNPGNGIFTLSFNTDNNVDNYAIKITDALGRAVYNENLNSFTGYYTKKVDIGKYGKGVYMLTITDSKNETVKKIIVQ